MTQNMPTDWHKVFSQNCAYTVDGVYGGKFVLSLAESIARTDKSVVRLDGKIVSDFRDIKDRK
jgi:hypothetical protein